VSTEQKKYHRMLRLDRAKVFRINQILIPNQVRRDVAKGNARKRYANPSFNIEEYDIYEETGLFEDDFYGLFNTVALEVIYQYSS
jgi:hypothetical protein